jgi:hypothetical protein
MESLYNSGASAAAAPSSITSMVFYVVIVVFIGLIGLIIIHYTYKPIFGKTSILSGGSGTVYWDSEIQTKHEKLIAEKTPIGDRYCDYSFCFDMIIDDALAGTGTTNDRPIMYRGTDAGNAYTAENNNFTIVLDKEMNDLIVKVKCREATGNESTIVAVVDNLPTQREFTIGVVLSETFMEIYLNGRLYRTRSFGSAKLLSTAGDFKNGIGADGTYARIKRLRLWEDVVTADTMRSFAATVSPSFSSKLTAGGQGTCSA